MFTRPWAPMPMPASVVFSLGAMWPGPPSTCRGTISESRRCAGHGEESPARHENSVTYRSWNMDGFEDSMAGFIR